MTQNVSTQVDGVDEDGKVLGRRELNSRRTRARLIDAAREVFDRDGFLESRITDITERADVGHGSFYNYFESKEEILLAALDQVHEEAFVGGSITDDGTLLSPVDRIERTNREYFEEYRRNARLLAIEEQLAVTNDVFAERRNVMRALYVKRAAAAIESWQQSGIAKRDIEPQQASELLCSMVERWVQMSCVFGQGSEPEKVLPVMLEIWSVTLGLEQSS